MEGVKTLGLSAGASAPETLVQEMIDQLAEKYTAERGAIATDVIAMLQDLADKGFLTEAREKTS